MGPPSFLLLEGGLFITHCKSTTYAGQAFVSRWYSTTYKNFIVLDNDIVIPNEMKRFEYYAPFLEKCGELSIRGTNCFNQTGLFNGYVVSNIDKFFSIHDINNDSSFNHLSIFNQNFNSPHNQYFGLLSNFGFLGLLIISISVYVFFKKILNKKNNLLFCIFILNLFIILNFDDYLFYNFFNVSYFLWLIIGLTCNKNLVIR